MYVARLRYIQSIHEAAERRNPDALVRHFIPALQRWRSAWLGRRELSKLRKDPFYYYLLARTKYYDQVVSDAVAEGVQQIVSIGCGTDTRSFRFLRLLKSKRVTVLECDQPKAIRIKRRMATRWRDADHVEYLSIDLNDEASWPDLERWLKGRPGKTLVMMEGVSPYVNDDAFERFLLVLARQLAIGSFVAYDFKVQGANDNFGREDGILRPFRLSRSRDQVAAFHGAFGLHLEHMESSAELCARLLPASRESHASPFMEDGLVRLGVEPCTR
jgi:methyltransferase (TIGR00027 family)